MKENVSQKILVEVLLREVQALQTANKELQRSIPVMKEQIDALKNTRLTAQINTEPLTKFNKEIEDRLKDAGEVAKVDTKPIEEFKTWFNTRLKSGFVVPSWVSFLSYMIVIWALIATGAVFYYRGESKENEAANIKLQEQNQYLSAVLRECEDQKPKGKKK